ncbi:MAG: DUF2997 domain-containing protein [Tepidisphaerales bacterium]
MTQTIEITVSPQGETTVQTKGFAGSSCKDASRFIERALGRVQSDQATAEMYQPATNTVQQSQRT